MMKVSERIRSGACPGYKLSLGAAHVRDVLEEVGHALLVLHLVRRTRQDFQIRFESSFGDFIRKNYVRESIGKFSFYNIRVSRERSVERICARSGEGRGNRRLNGCSCW